MIKTRAVEEKADAKKYLYKCLQSTNPQEDRIIRWLLSKHELRTNDTLGLIERGKIHLRMHTSKLIYGILEHLAISVGRIIVELLFCLLEELDIFSQHPYHLP